MDWLFAYFLNGDPDRLIYEHNGIFYTDESPVRKKDIIKKGIYSETTIQDLVDEVFGYEDM